MEKLAIILLTYERTEYALRTIAAARANLEFDGEIVWIMADDGSRQEHVDAVLSCINAPTHWRSQRDGYGANANWAWSLADEIGIDVTLWLEDDWELRRRLDVTGHVTVLRNRNDIGMIRLGYFTTGIIGESIGIDGRIYLNISKQKNAFSGHPHLKHSRMRRLGGYPTGFNPGDTELYYNRIVSRDADPKILWPLEMGEEHVFGHIGAIKSY